MPHPDDSWPETRRLRLTVEYDGTHFQGFQRQATGRTVQAVLEAALQQFTPDPGVLAAGRTDSGVHASGQVVHLNYAGRMPIARLASVLNGQLPADVAIRDCREVEARFHARYSALSRTYRYQVFWAPARLPMRERYAWRLDRPLDLSAVNQTVALLPGTHSFRHFGQIPGSPAQRQRSQERRGWRRVVWQAGMEQQADALCFTIEADAFLTHMVRAIVGALVAVGRGRLTPAQVETALQDQSSDVPLAPIAPPHGLCLFRVRYPDEM